MKKAYEKPNVVIMKLRPEERMALCDQVNFNGPGGACNKLMFDLPAQNNQCVTSGNNSQSTNS